MPQVDDEYRKKSSLARFKQRLSRKPNIPASMMPYQAKATPISNRAAKMGLIMDQPLPIDPSGAAGIGSIGGRAAGRIVTPLIGRIAGPTMQRALDVAEAEGRQVNAGLLSDNAAQGVRYSQDSIVRGGKAAQEELFNFLDQMQRMGVKPATANRLLRGFAKYIDDPVEGIVELGGNVARTRPGESAKERLVQRLLRRMGDAAEDSFF
jgi:hypothetical protein